MQVHCVHALSAVQVADDCVPWGVRRVFIYISLSRIGRSRDRSPVVSLGIFSEAYDGTMCPGVDSTSKNEYQDTPGSKAGRCVRLTTYHLHVPNVKKIRGLNLPDPQGPVQACSGTALLCLYLVEY
jgi:hypothetical protein